MPRRMEAPPESPKKSTEKPQELSDGGLRVIRAAIELNASATPTSASPEKVYELIQNDRPIKLTGKQAGFERGNAQEGHGCGSCWHYFAAVGKERKKAQKGACEVVRPDDGNPSIALGDYCHFAFTLDGVTFPLRNAEGTKETLTKPALMPTGVEEKAQESKR